MDFNLPAAPPPVKPLAFALDEAFAHNPHTGETMGADSLSLFSTIPKEKVYRDGILLLVRFTLGEKAQSQWLEQLYVSGRTGYSQRVCFWIFHEEKQGSFVFDGRRDVRTFLETAASLGLRVLLRIGPWNHGEIRNGGHPDWVLKEENCGSNLRSADPKYLQCVESWYKALGNQVKGLFWKDGGPVFAVQLDNETVDWKYLLALKALARKYFSPVYFSKTGWPKKRETTREPFVNALLWRVSRRAGRSYNECNSESRRIPFSAFDCCRRLSISWSRNWWGNGCTIQP